VQAHFQYLPTWNTLFSPSYLSFVVFASNVQYIFWCLKNSAKHITNVTCHCWLLNPTELYTNHCIVFIFLIDLYPWPRGARTCIGTNSSWDFQLHLQNPKVNPFEKTETHNRNLTSLFSIERQWTSKQKNTRYDHRECQEHQSKRTVQLLSANCAQPLLSALSLTSKEIHNRDPTTSIVFTWTCERSVFTGQHVFFFLLELRIVRRGRGTYSTVLTPSRGATSAQITTSMTTESRKIEERREKVKKERTRRVRAHFPLWTFSSGANYAAFRTCPSQSIKPSITLHEPLPRSNFLQKFSHRCNFVVALLWRGLPQRDASCHGIATVELFSATSSHGSCYLIALASSSAKLQSSRRRAAIALHRLLQHFRGSRRGALIAQHRLLQNFRGRAGELWLRCIVFCKTSEVVQERLQQI
jgi:hypothetical protein